MSNSLKSDHAISYEGMRKVVGGNGSGTPDGLAPISVAAYDFFLSDIGTIISTEATAKEKLEAAVYTFIKPAKVLETGHDLVLRARNQHNFEEFKFLAPYKNLLQTFLQGIFYYIRTYSKISRNFSDSFVPSDSPV